MKQFLKTAKGRAVMISAAILLIVILLFLTLGGEAAYRSISISEISGTVVAENNGNSYEAYKNMVIGGGYSLTTNAESYTRMLLDSDKYMKLEERSCARFESLGSPTEHRTAIRLDYGALSTEITAPLSGDEDFVVNTPNAVLAVRGTFFRVEVSFDTNGDAYTDVYTYGGAVACRRVMPNGTVVDENVVVDTGYKARIKMDEIITIYVEELIEETSDNVDPLEMNDIQNGQLVDVYNASVHGHEMFRSTKAFWDEIVERKIDIKDYASAYDGEEIPPYAEEDAETTETFVTTSVPETSETAPASETSETAPASETSETSPAPATAGRMDFPNDTGMRQPESSLLPGTTGSAPITTVASVPPAVTTAEQTSSELLPETDSTAAPTGNVAAETAGTDPIGTSAATPAGTSGSAGKPTVTTVPSETTVPTSVKTTESPEETEETEGSASTAAAAETVTTTAWENTAPSAEIVTRPQAFTTSRAPIPAVTTISMQPSHVHTPVEETVAASCTENGAVRTKCSVCGVIISETVISAPGHNTGRVTVAATCDADGERLDVCKLCGVIVSRAVIPATGHITDTTTIAATCVRNGERTEKCRICGTVLSAAILPAAGHTRITETAEATCTASGSTTVKCSVCGEIFSREIVPATGHIMDTAIVAATCERDGERTEKCRICGTVLSTAVIPAAGHTQVTETVEATCTASGFTTVKCSVCGKILSLESIPVTAHIADITTVAATCEENGERAEKCRICGTVLSTTVIPAAGHSYEATETKPASCTEEGEEAEICTVCGQEKPDSAVAIPKLPHTEVTESDGSVETVKCAVCGEIISRTALINETNFPDEVFRNYILDHFDTDESGSLSETELSQITEIAVSGEVGSLKGIELLPALESVRATVHIEDGVIAIADVGGIDPSRVSGVSGGNYDESTGTISEIADGTEITLIYTPEGGKSVTFTLIPDETSTFWTETPEGIAVNAENFPDEVFRNYVSENFDSDMNGYLSEEEIAAVTEIRVNGNSSLDDGGVVSLKGIEYFTVLTELRCQCNSGLTELDVSNNAALKTLYCSLTAITSLNVSQNTALTSLYCANSQLAYVDVSNNPSFSVFSASHNKHPITVVNGSFDTHTIDSFDPTRVSNVVGAEWDETTGVFSNITEGTTEITYTYDCTGTNKDIFKVTFTLVPDENSTFEPETPEGVAINEENFPDEVFRNYVSENFDTDGDGALSEEEREAVTKIDIAGTTPYDDGGVASMKGVEYFPELTELKCFSNSGLSVLDVSQNTELRTLWCAGTAITSLDVSNNTALTQLNCNHTQITSLDVSNNTALEILYCNDTQIASLDVSNNTALTKLICDSTQITSLDVNNNIALETLGCGNTPIISLDVSQNTALTWLNCSYMQITSLDVSNNRALIALICTSTQITSLDVSNNRALNILDCGNTVITSLDVSNNTALGTLICGDAPITVLDVSQNTKLWNLECNDTQITSLDVSNNTALTKLNCSGTQIVSLDVSQNTALINLWCDKSQLAFVDISNNPSLSLSDFVASGNKHPITVTDGSFDTYTIDGFNPARVSNVQGAEWDEVTGVFSGIAEGTTEITYTYDCKGTNDDDYKVTFTLVPDENSTFEPETPEGVAINEENFPDEVFRNYVSENFDSDTNGYLSEAEIAAVTRIDVGGTYSSDGEVTSLKGVEYFSGLTYLSCRYNNGLTELDVNKDMALKTLYCYDTQISSLDVSKNTALEVLDCDGTQIAELDVSQNTALTQLDCSKTQITSLDVSQNTALADLRCNDTQITSLDVSKNMVLQYLRCNDTQITSLDVRNNTALKDLLCNNTQITSLNISQNTSLEVLYCNNTQITSLDVSRNTKLITLQCNNCQLTSIKISNNPNLTTFIASGNQYKIPSNATMFDSVSDLNFQLSGFNPNRVSNVVGANFSPESGIFDNFTSDTITYTYDCDGAGGHNVTFTLVRSDEAVGASIYSEDDTPENYAVFPSDNTTNTPPGASDADIPASGEGAFPSGGAELFSLLPSAGLLALAHSRKRKTAFRFAQKAEIN